MFLKNDIHYYCKRNRSVQHSTSELVFVPDFDWDPHITAPLTCATVLDSILILSNCHLTSATSSWSGKFSVVKHLCFGKLTRHYIEAIPLLTPITVNASLALVQMITSHASVRIRPSYLPRCLYIIGG